MWRFVSYLVAMLFMVLLITKDRLVSCAIAGVILQTLAYLSSRKVATSAQLPSHPFIFGRRGSAEPILTRSLAPLLVRQYLRRTKHV